MVSEQMVGQAFRSGLYPRIIKQGGMLVVPSNLADYLSARNTFNRAFARAQHDGLPGGRGLNIAHEAVDRHAVGPVGSRDMACYGGCYAVTKGLAQQLGDDRIRDTPLAENGFVGAGIGAAIAGVGPIVVIKTVNFSLLALDQIVNSAATIPRVIRFSVHEPRRPLPIGARRNTRNPRPPYSRAGG